MLPLAAAVPLRVYPVVAMKRVRVVDIAAFARLF
jgi:hypothetical protein